MDLFDIVAARTSIKPIDMSNYITRTDIEEYVTETELNDKGYLTEHQSLEGLATENYVKNAIAEAELSGSDEPVDLSGYATKDDIKKWEQFKNYCKTDCIVEREIRKKLSKYKIPIFKRLVNKTLTKYTKPKSKYLFSLVKI